MQKEHCVERICVSQDGQNWTKTFVKIYADNKDVKIVHCNDVTPG